MTTQTTRETGLTRVRDTWQGSRAAAWPRYPVRSCGATPARRPRQTAAQRAQIAALVAQRAALMHDRDMGCAPPSAYRLALAVVDGELEAARRG